MLQAERRKARSARAAPDAPAPAAAPVASSWADTTTFIMEPRPRQLLTEAHLLHKAVPDVWHISEWVSEAEEAALLACADAAPPSAWTHLRGRRLRCLGGVPTQAGIVQEPLPRWIETLCDALVAARVFVEGAPNHALVNEYQPGDGIEAHRDGPLYEPTVAILSLGSHCTFDFVANDVGRRQLTSLLLPRRGLLVFSGAAYHEHLHRVRPCAADAPDELTLRLDADDDDGATPATPPPTLPRSRRLSLTIRRVLPPSVPEPAARDEAAAHCDDSRARVDRST